MSLPEHSMPKGKNELRIVYFACKLMIRCEKENFKLLSQS